MNKTVFNPFSVVNLSRQTGKHSVNIGRGLEVVLSRRIRSPGSSPGDQVPGGGPGLRSNRMIWRHDLFHHAQSKAQRSLPSVPPLLRVPPASPRYEVRKRVLVKASACLTRRLLSPKKEKEALQRKRQGAGKESF